MAKTPAPSTAQQGSAPSPQQQQQQGQTPKPVQQQGGTVIRDWASI